jgi:hypothetical protein
VLQIGNEETMTKLLAIAASALTGARAPHEMFNAPNHVELGNPATGRGNSNAAGGCFWYDYLDQGKYASDTVCSQV